jgi:hypothetical protein
MYATVLLALLCAAPETAPTTPPNRAVPSADPAAAKPEPAAAKPEPSVPKPAALTYSKDIAPIFQQHCQECHRPGEVAPMTLLSFKDVRRWKRSIKKEIQSRAMPPWHADPKIGHWRNDRRMEASDIEKVVRWIDAGAQEGDRADLPPTKTFRKGWQIGTPSLIFQTPTEFRVKAEGTIPYKYFTVPTNFTEDKWVRAVEVRPGSPAVVHHIIVFIQGPKGGRLRPNSLWRNHLGGIAPGESPDIFPPGCGKLIPAGSNLVFQMHYTPNGKETTDRSKIGLYFSDDEGRKPLRRVHLRAAMNPWLRIPAGATEHKVDSSYTIREDAQILSLMPHMHLRGKSFRFELVKRDGTRSTILDVPHYDFDWQHNYLFQKPLRVELGDKIYCSARFDNSKDNEANPDPTKSVRWGDQTWQEMMIGFIAFVKDDGKPVYPDEGPAVTPKAVTPRAATPKAASNESSAKAN